MSDFYPHQVAAGESVLALIRKHGVAYLSGQPRTGKTRTSFYVANNLPVQNVLFVTKKNAIPGIKTEVKVCTKNLTITNYEQVSKLDPKNFDFVICDEAHNISTPGKPTKRFKDLKRIAWEKPTLLLSGTPWVETPSAAYYQFGITRYTPLRFKNFYDFFRQFGTPSLIWVNGRQVETYKKTRRELEPLLDQYCVKITQDAAGIDAQAEDVVHHVHLSQDTLDTIKQVREEAVTIISGAEFAFDSDAAVRAAIHQLEAGAFLYKGQIVHTAGAEIAEYIRQTFGDSPDVAVMAHYRSTREKLAKHLPKVHLYSSDGHSEGVDLSHYKHFVIVNTGYSGAKHVQRRDRGTRMDIKTPRKVHHIVCKGQLSEAVYKQVSRKLDFNLQHFRRYVGK